MSDDATKRFHRRKFNWLRASANRLPAVAQGIVIRFALDHLNDTTRRAWIGVQTLADELGATRRSVQRALDLLVKDGWLDREVKRGRGNTNRYTISSRFDDEKEGAAAPVSDVKGVAGDAISEHKRRRFEPEKASFRAVKGVAGDARLYAARSARAATEEPSLAGSTGRQYEPAAKRGVSRRYEERKQKTSFPEDWVCGPAECEVAASLAGWDPERAEREFEKMRDWFNDDEHADLRFADWMPKWESRCRKGREIDQREAEQSARKQNGSRRGNGRADQLDALQEALQDKYDEYQRRAHEHQED